MDLHRIVRCSARGALTVTHYVVVKLIDALTFTTLFVLLNLPSLIPDESGSNRDTEYHGAERVTIRLLPNEPEPGRSVYFNIRRGWIPYGQGQAIWVITNDVEYSQIVSDDDCDWRAERYHRESINPLFSQEGQVTQGRANRRFNAHICIFTITVPILPNQLQATP